MRTCCLAVIKFKVFKMEKDLEMDIPDGHTSMCLKLLNCMYIKMVYLTYTHMYVLPKLQIFKIFNDK